MIWPVRWCGIKGEDLEGAVASLVSAAKSAISSEAVSSTLSCLASPLTPNSLLKASLTFLISSLNWSMIVYSPALILVSIVVLSSEDNRALLESGLSIEFGGRA